MKNRVVLKKVKRPDKDCTLIPVALTEKTLNERKEKVLNAMRDNGYRQLVIYGDVEHGSNFEYLIGYFTRFEEALAILFDDGRLSLVLGNENLNKSSKARLNNSSYLASDFSLPNQPVLNDEKLTDTLRSSGLLSNVKTGIVGWKLMKEDANDFDIPSFILKRIYEIVEDKDLVKNATTLFIGEKGVRNTNNANEIAHYEFGASLASDCALDAMDKVDIGVSEMELGDALVRYGQHTSIVTIASSGERFIKGNMFPTDRTVKVGDPVSLTVGYRGGSSSRAAVAAKTKEDLNDDQKDYLDKVVFPYFDAYSEWLKKIHVGMKGDELFRLIDDVLPRKIYGWKLCPGHLTAEEEWSCSPIYENSQELIRSGMIFQIDIIPSVSGYPGTCAESTVVIADSKLKKAIEEEYPDMYKRMMRRREYIINELGISLSDDVLPMCSTVAYLRPLLLDKDSAVACEN